MNNPGVVTLQVGGKLYAGFQTARVTRAIDRMGSSFDIAVHEQWPAQDTPWQISPFDPCQVLIDGKPVLTGYVDDYIPEFGPTSHSVRITGRSKTEDIIDCTPDIRGGQFSGFTLDAIARAIAAPFGIDVVVQADVGEAFPDATMQRHETGFAFLERLARLRSVLLSDDELGRLVLTTAGAGHATDRLVQGQNIQSGRAKLSGTKRFSVYIVKTQKGVSTAAPGNPGYRPWTDPEPPDPKASSESNAAYHGRLASYAAANDVPQTGVVTGVQGTAYDSGVPRYRPHVIVAESGLDGPGAQRRALWEAKHAKARGTEATVDAVGFYQKDGTLWSLNIQVGVTSAFLKLDDDLLIASISYEMDDRRGRVTRMVLGPVDGYQPDPGQVRVKRGKKGKGGKGDPYGGVLGIGSSPDA